VESYRQNPDGSYTAVLRPRRLVKNRVRHVKIMLDEELDIFGVFLRTALE